jgi:hypothetical protein
VCRCKPVCVSKKANSDIIGNRKQGRKYMMQCFVVEHYLDKAIDVYCGGPDIFNGTVEACADNVLTLKNDGKFTHIAIDKIIAVWPIESSTAATASGASSHHVHRK